jgi:hypothetical protein
MKDFITTVIIGSIIVIVLFALLITAIYVLLS